MYIFDSSSFGALANYYPPVMPTVWSIVNTLSDNGSLRSVREVYRELQEYTHDKRLIDWLGKHKYIFLAPNTEELNFLKTMFEREQYRNLVRSEKISKGKPVSDPFLIAAARVHNAIIVTEEKLKTGAAARIPNVCQDFKVKCICLEEFMLAEGVHY